MGNSQPSLPIHRNISIKLNHEIDDIIQHPQEMDAIMEEILTTSASHQQYHRHRRSRGQLSIGKLAITFTGIYLSIQVARYIIRRMIRRRTERLLQELTADAPPSSSSSAASSSISSELPFN